MQVVSRDGELKLIDKNNIDAFALDIFSGDIEFYCFNAEITHFFEPSDAGILKSDEAIVCDASINYHCLDIFDFDSFARDFTDQNCNSISFEVERKNEGIKELRRKEIHSAAKNSNRFVDSGTTVYDAMLQNETARVIINRANSDESCRAWLTYHDYVRDFFQTSVKNFRYKLRLTLELPSSAYDAVRNSILAGDAIERLNISVTMEKRDYSRADLNSEKTQEIMFAENIFCERHGEYYRLIFANRLKTSNSSLNLPMPVRCAFSKLQLVHNRVNIKSNWHKALYGTWDNPKCDEKTITDAVHSIEKLVALANDTKMSVASIASSRKLWRWLFKR